MFKKFFKSSNGQAVTELALVLPIFLLLVFGVIEMSRIGYSYLTLNNAVRSGARVASLGGLDNDIKNTIKGSAPLFDGASITIQITPNESTRRSGSSVMINASYPVYLNTPFLSQVLPNPVTISTSLAMRIE
ncbi:MAG: pilus assembly protein [Peptococcaceae bacterium]|nr:pilus assembly protein [Peptococcaceae bacterium]